MWVNFKQLWADEDLMKIRFNPCSRTFLSLQKIMKYFLQIHWRRLEKQLHHNTCKTNGNMRGALNVLREMEERKKWGKKSLTSEVR